MVSFLKGRRREDDSVVAVDSNGRNVAAALEALIYPERAPLARVVLAAGSFGYDPRDDAEVVRIARLIADEPEVASLDHDDLRTRLASVRNGSTFTF